MELTKEILLQRKASLEADMHAISGALQQIDWSLEIMEQEEAPPAPPILE